MQWAKRPLSTIETFALEFVPPSETDKLAESTKNLELDTWSTADSVTEPIDTDASEVPTVSVHALDVLAEINVQKNPKLAKQYLQELAGTYDTMRKNYWEFRMEKLGEA